MSDTTTPPTVHARLAGYVTWVVCLSVALILLAIVTSFMASGIYVYDIDSMVEQSSLVTLSNASLTVGGVGILISIAVAALRESTRKVD